MFNRRGAPRKGAKHAKRLYAGTETSFRGVVVFAENGTDERLPKR